MHLHFHLDRKQRKIDLTCFFPEHAVTGEEGADVRKDQNQTVPKSVESMPAGIEEGHTELGQQQEKLVSNAKSFDDPSTREQGASMLESSQSGVDYIYQRSKSSPVVVHRSQPQHQDLQKELRKINLELEQSIPKYHSSEIDGLSGADSTMTRSLKRIPSRSRQGRTGTTKNRFKSCLCAVCKFPMLHCFVSKFQGQINAALSGLAQEDILELKSSLTPEPRKPPVSVLNELKHKHPFCFL